MLKIRLFRTGKKNQPSFKVVVTNKTNAPAGGRYLEQVGFSNPLTKEKNLNTERIQYWISRGAKPSDTVHNMLVSGGVIKGKKIPVHTIVPVQEKAQETVPTEPKEKSTPEPKEEEKSA